jgi:hypothetical protein
MGAPVYALHGMIDNLVHVFAFESFVEQRGIGLKGHTGDNS